MSNETEIKQVPSYNRNGGYMYPQEFAVNGTGITRRDWLAGLAMQSNVLRGNYAEDEDIAKWCYQIADAMIAGGWKGGE